MKPFFIKLFKTGLALLILFFTSSFTYALYLKWFPPITTPHILGTAMAAHKSGWQLTSRWKEYSGISNQLKVAVIASEDQKFAQHHGFDFEAIKKAYIHNKKGRKVHGASTISQQVAKNVFLWQGRSWIRKGLEVYFTALIELLWSKERILTLYLNVAEMGEGIFGAEAAAQSYFHKPAKNLNQDQATVLAAILPSPVRYKAVNPGPYVLKRKGNIKRFMRQIGGEKYLDSL